MTLSRVGVQRSTFMVGGSSNGVDTVQLARVSRSWEVRRTSPPLSTCRVTSVTKFAEVDATALRQSTSEINSYKSEMFGDTRVYHYVQNRVATICF